MRITVVAVIAIFLAIGTTYAVKKLRSDSVPEQPAYSDFRASDAGDTGDAGCSCCNKGPQGAGLEGLQKQAANYYMNIYRDTDFEVSVKDFGCHQEAYIIKDGKVVKTLSINGGRIEEVG
jgi:hypothetical protein